MSPALLSAVYRFVAVYPEDATPSLVGREIIDCRFPVIAMGGNQREGQIGQDRNSKPLRIAYLALVEIDVANACSVHTRELAEHLAASGHEVMLIMPKPMHAQAWRGISHVWVRWWGFSQLRHLAFCVESAWRLILLHRRRSFDALYVREMPRHYPFLPALTQWLNLPLFVEVNGWLLEELRIEGVPAGALESAKRRQQALFQAAAGILVSTVGNADKVEAHYGIPRRQIVVQELGTNTEHFSPGDKPASRMALGLSPDWLIVLFAGSFNPHHDLGTLLEAFARMAAVEGRARLVLVGHGALWNSLRARREALGLADRVLMPGNVPYGRVTQYFRAADIGVLPLTASNVKQRNGAIALKLWDYMAAGLPVVVTDFPSTPSASLLADKAAVVPPEDPDAMAKAFADLLGSTSKRARLAEAGLNYVRQHRTWRQAAAETADFIAKRLHDSA